MEREASPNNEGSLLLFVEDDPHLAELVRHVLAEVTPEFDVEQVGRLSTALARLVRQSFSLILTDLNHPDSHGPATVRHLRRAAPDVPLVVFSGNTGPDVALECPGRRRRVPGQGNARLPGPRPAPPPRPRRRRGMVLHHDSGEPTP